MKAALYTRIPVEQHEALTRAAGRLGVSVATLTAVLLPSPAEIDEISGLRMEISVVTVTS